MWNFCIGLIILAFSVPFLPALIMYAWCLFGGFLAICVLTGIGLLVWSWTVQPFIDFLKQRDSEK